MNLREKMRGEEKEEDHGGEKERREKGKRNMEDVIRKIEGE